MAIHVKIEKSNASQTGAGTGASGSGRSGTAFI
jgi:hypothetical protein